MIAIKNILCPTDLSDESDAALRYAIALARTYGAKLMIYHCVTASTHGHDLTLRALKTRIEASVRKWSGIGNCPPADYEGVLVEGDPVEAINKAAAVWRADMIVMRSRRRPQSAALLGSTAEAICRTAPCPVLITHPNEREWVGLTTCEIDLRKILVACDFSIDSELALQLALSFAQEYQTELYLLNVLPAALSNAPPQIEKDFHRAARLLRQSVPDEVYLWCKVYQAVKSGQPYCEILSYIEENDIDLICMGVHGAGFAMRALFGSNTDRVLRQAPCPVLIARPLKPATINEGKQLYE